jgi:hypothetical protein
MDLQIDTSVSKEMKMTVRFSETSVSTYVHTAAQAEDQHRHYFTAVRTSRSHTLLLLVVILYHSKLCNLCSWFGVSKESHDDQRLGFQPCNPKKHCFLYKAGCYTFCICFRIRFGSQRCGIFIYRIIQTKIDSGLIGFVGDFVQLVRKGAMIIVTIIINHGSFTLRPLYPHGYMKNVLIRQQSGRVFLSFVALST